VLDAPVFVTAVVSNLVVSEAGVLFFVAVRNATAPQADSGGWERVMLAVDGTAGEVLWSFPPTGDLFDPAPRLQPGQDLQTVSLALTRAAVIFCGALPRNASIDGDFGIGAVSAAGGELVSAPRPSPSAQPPRSLSPAALAADPG